MDKTKLIYGNFTMDRIEEVVDLIVDSFSRNNPFLTTGAQTPQARRKSSTKLIDFYYSAMNSLNKDKGTNYQLMKVLIYEGQIVAFAMVCQLHRMIDYNMANPQPGGTSAIVFDFFNKKSYNENQVLYGSLLAVHKDYMKYKLSIILLQKTFKQWSSYGFKSLAGVSNNPISLKVFQSFGAKVVKEIKINEKGKELTKYLISNDLADVIWPKL